ncbi:protein LORF2 [Gallid alphaherpesvirus 1]|uniref:Protein LORF2 n=1 Tax=Infectious laryngotracheitis virus TaxID=10386 RepID=A0A0K0K641_ILTV|nr:protein LORF2 [Gallid alphaherpesvirus 1]AGN48376.1 protein LORF2 [Gallid alphaherpesvirus 1]
MAAARRGMAINFARMGDEENLSRVQKDLTVELELTPQLTERILEIEEPLFPTRMHDVKQLGKLGEVRARHENPEEGRKISASDHSAIQHVLDNERTVIRRHQSGRMSPVDEYLMVVKAATMEMLLLHKLTIKHILYILKAFVRLKEVVYDIMTRTNQPELLTEKVYGGAYEIFLRFPLPVRDPESMAEDFLQFLRHSIRWCRKFKSRTNRRGHKADIGYLEHRTNIQENEMRYYVNPRKMPKKDTLVRVRPVAPERYKSRREAAFKNSVGEVTIKLPVRDAGDPLVSSVRPVNVSVAIPQSESWRLRAPVDNEFVVHYRHSSSSEDARLSTSENDSDDSMNDAAVQEALMEDADDAPFGAEDEQLSSESNDSDGNYSEYDPPPEMVEGWHGGGQGGRAESPQPLADVREVEPRDPQRREEPIETIVLSSESDLSADEGENNNPMQRPTDPRVFLIRVRRAREILRNVGLDDRRIGPHRGRDRYQLRSRSRNRSRSIDGHDL